MIFVFVTSGGMISRREGQCNPPATSAREIRRANSQARHAALREAAGFSESLMTWRWGEHCLEVAGIWRRISSFRAARSASSTSGALLAAWLPDGRCSIASALACAP